MSKNMSCLFQCLYKGLQHTVDSWTLNLTNLTITNDVSYSGSQSHHLDVRAEQQKAFLEYQSDKEKIGFRLPHQLLNFRRYALYSDGYVKTSQTPFI